MEPHPWEIGLVCGINTMIALSLLACWPAAWRLRSQLHTAAQALDRWSDATEKALQPTPQELLRLRQYLIEQQDTLTQIQKQIEWLQTLYRLSRWLLSRFK